MNGRLRVLDCFGTIVFTTSGRPDHRRMASAFAADFGCGEDQAKAFVYPVVSHAWLPQTPSLDVAAHAATFAGKVESPEQDLLAFLWSWAGPGEGGWVVPDGVRRALDAWTAEGGELRLMTNCALAPSQLDQALSDLGLRDFFSQVLASSSGAGKKPQESWFRRAFEGDFIDAAMVGDHPEFDIAPAQALGIPAIRVTGQAYWSSGQNLLLEVNPDETRSSRT